VSGWLPPAALERLPAALAPLPRFAERFREIARDSVLSCFPPDPARPETGPESVDSAAEEQFLAAVRESFPDASVLSEELFRGHGTVIPGTGDLRVLLDPLDGSHTFLAGSPRFGCTVAFELAGVIECGIVCQPAADRSWVALRGAGAYGDGVRLTPPAAGPRVVAMKSSLQLEEEGRALVARLNASRYEVERLESTSIKLCMTAEGGCAGVVKRVSGGGGVLQPWGLAAGALICAEAGVAVTDFGGEPWTTLHDTFVAGTAEVHAVVRAAHTA
jgi:myo-inositol-1(or 4)-monophosphatase